MLLTTGYKTVVLPKIQKELSLKNIFEVPMLEKIVINIGIGSYIIKKNKDFSNIESNLSKVSGQKPLLIKSKKSVSNFKLRKFMPNGLKVTLRGKRMLEFLDRLIHVALPRTRDFRGLSKKAYDGNGNYSLGISEVIIFPEIQIDDMKKLHGMQINISTTAKDDKQAHVLLSGIGIPFKK